MTMRRIDASERIVAKYLTHCGFSRVEYEPDGNVPPDFLVDGRIAVEVRRLNQNYVDGKSVSGLEELTIPLRRRFKELLYSLGPPTRGVSWFVFFRLHRPVERWKTLGPKIRRELEGFIAGTIHAPTRISIGERFEIRIFPSQLPYPVFFVMGGNADRDSDGWLLPEMQKNIQLCIDEKTRKVARVRAKYSAWWLVLVDQIACGLKDHDRQQFRDQVVLVHDWDKVVLVNPLDPTSAFEV